MTHIPVSGSDKTRISCVVCDVAFSVGQSTTAVSCPVCRTQQPFPVVLVDRNTARCLLCGCRMGIAEANLPQVCPNGHGPLHWCGHQLLDPEQVHYCDYISLGVLEKGLQPFGLGEKSQAVRHPDEQLFVGVHQACEILFLIHIQTLRESSRALREQQLERAKHLVVRLKELTRTSMEVMRLLLTMTPTDFKVFRGSLVPASGLESENFRVIEVLSGIEPDQEYGADRDGRPFTFKQFLDRAPEPGVGRPKTRLWTPRLEAASKECSLRRAFLRIGEEAKGGDVLEKIKTALLRYEQCFKVWRIAHLKLVELQLGMAPGTGHTSGFSYLQSVIDKARFFPEIPLP